MSQIRFYDGKILFVGGQIAFSEDCCCGDEFCDCDILALRIEDACLHCANEDYPLNPEVTRQVQLSISGVANGANTGCTHYNDNPFGQQFLSSLGVLSNPTCETTTAVADGTSFFNADFILDPCTGPFITWECRYKCSSTSFANGFPGVNVDYFEYNILEIAFTRNPVGSGGTWGVSAIMESYVAGVQRPTPGTICTSIGTYQQPNKRLLTGLGLDNFLSVTLLSRRRKTFSLSRVAGVRPGYFYDPTYCTTECNSEILLPKCLQTGDTFTMDAGYPVSDSFTCQKALDFGSATATVTVL